MTNPFDAETAEFIVLINEEGQHSLWPSFKTIPDGWSAVGPKGDKKTCTDWIDANWTDMRPLSLVRAMEEASAAKDVEIS